MTYTVRRSRVAAHHVACRHIAPWTQLPNKNGFLLWQLVKNHYTLAPIWTLSSRTTTLDVALLRTSGVQRVRFVGCMLLICRSRSAIRLSGSLTLPLWAEPRGMMQYNGIRRCESPVKRSTIYVCLSGYRTSALTASAQDTGKGVGHGCPGIPLAGRRRCREQLRDTLHAQSVRERRWARCLYTYASSQRMLILRRTCPQNFYPPLSPSSALSGPE